MLESWNDGTVKSAIVDFVERAVADLPPDDRVAVFDNDGTLWCEKPAYVQLDFLVRRLAEQANADPTLAARQPYRAAIDGDLAWFGDAVTAHYQGDDSQLGVLSAGVLSAYSGLTTEEHAARVSEFFATARHPTLGRRYTDCRYAPMVELLRYLDLSRFTNYIVSGGGRDFMRPVTGAMYGIPPERVVGSSVGVTFSDGQLRTTTQPEFLDDGPVKPARIWGRIGRRPILAAGNSNGDIEMLQYTQASSYPSLQLLLVHDDAEREFGYIAGAEKAFELAKANGWVTVSMRENWSTIFSA